MSQTTDISITGLHSLRTPEPYSNYATCIEDGKYHHFIFSRYRDGRWTGESWSGVVKDTDLFRLLKQASYLSKKAK